VADQVRATREQARHVDRIDGEVTSCDGRTLKVAAASGHEQTKAIREWALRGPVIVGGIAARCRAPRRLAHRRPIR
jgi:hypothetical protein